MKSCETKWFLNGDEKPRHTRYEFSWLDKVNYDMLTNRVLKENYNFGCPTISYKNDKNLHIQCKFLSFL